MATNMDEAVKMLDDEFPHLVFGLDQLNMYFQRVVIKIDRYVLYIDPTQSVLRKDRKCGFIEHK